MKSTGTSLPFRSRCLLGGKSFLLTSGSIGTRPKKTKRAQTSMLLILGFAETSIASKPIALQDREVPWGKRGGPGSEGARLESADVGVGRLPGGLDRENKQPRGGRGGGPLGASPSAAVGRIAPEERAIGEIT